MVNERKLWKSWSVLATLVLYVFMTQTASAAHGGGGHGGGGHGGGEHGGGFHGGGHHEGGHSQHAYRPSNHHAAHHDNRGDHNRDHRDHHHDGWHHGGWGPGYEGGWGPVYGGWGGWGYGGDTVVNNTYDESSDDGDSGSDSGDNDSGDVASDDNSNGNNQQTAANSSNTPSFPTDNWPELGLVTYSGEYGGSDGQVIMRVIPNSAAAKAGLVPGDVILTFNGAPVPSADELDQALTSANGKFQAEVWDSRTGRRSTLTGSYNPAPAAPPTKTTAFTPAPAK
jgi:hypothetical protein